MINYGVFVAESRDSLKSCTWFFHVAGAAFRYIIRTTQLVTIHAFYSLIRFVQFASCAVLTSVTSAC